MKLKIMLAVLLLCGAVNLQAAMQEELLGIQQAWAEARYKTAADAQEAAFETLIEQARKFVAAYPQQAEPRVWLAICLSTDAGVNGGLGALGKVKEAKALLEEAEKIDPDVLDGSVYTSLGSLYYQVPGWPIAFGNDEMAEKYLKMALSKNPEGIDPNFFYADFLLAEDRPKEALQYLEKARMAPPRPNRLTADEGRRAEVEQAIEKARKML